MLKYLFAGLFVSVIASCQRVIKRSLWFVYIDFVLL
jgi:hypothetical protein